MSALRQHVADYLSMRRSLEFKLTFPGQVLPDFADFLDAADATTVTTELAIAWAGLPQGRVQPIMLAHRLGAVRGFARWLATIDPDTEVPPAGVWPSSARRPTPYLWSTADIAALLEVARALPSPLRAATHEALFGLLAATGMRIGEALALAVSDVGLTDGVITIRQAKFNRERLVPLHPTTTAAMRHYAEQRDQLCRRRRSTSFFVSTQGTPLEHAGVLLIFNKLTSQLGLRTPTVRPRIHDLRHSFAVRTLLDWHRAGLDVAGRMAVLSVYLGHINPSGTYWYLSAAPELMVLVAARLESGSGGSR
jgi:site-specific recombinase XerD